MRYLFSAIVLELILQAVVFGQPPPGPPPPPPPATAFTTTVANIIRIGTNGVPVGIAGGPSGTPFTPNLFTVRDILIGSNSNEIFAAHGSQVSRFGYGGSTNWNSSLSGQIAIHSMRDAGDHLLVAGEFSNANGLRAIQKQSGDGGMFFAYLGPSTVFQISGYTNSQWVLISLSNTVQKVDIQSGYIDPSYDLNTDGVVNAVVAY